MGRAAVVLRKGRGLRLQLRGDRVLAVTVDDADTAKSYANIGQWVGIGGVVLTAVGATLLLTAPSSDQRASTRRVVASPWLGPAGGGFAVSGSL